jgi:hypothetical protein
MVQACEIALTEAKAALATYPELERVVFVSFSAAALAIYRETFAKAFA